MLWAVADNAKVAGDRPRFSNWGKVNLEKIAVIGGKKSFNGGNREVIDGVIGFCN